MTIKILFILMGATRSKFQNNLATCCDIQFLSRFFLFKYMQKENLFLHLKQEDMMNCEASCYRKKKKMVSFNFCSSHTHHLVGGYRTLSHLNWIEFLFNFFLLLLLLLPVPLKMKNSFLPATKFQILTFHFCLPVSRILKIRVSFLWK